MSAESTPPRRFGDYFLFKKIATGGMAEIYLAKTRTAMGPEKYVAIKMIHPRYMEEQNFHHMIVEEAKIAVQLGHKNVGQVFDLGQVDGRYFLVMEFIDGYDLSRLHDVCRDKRLPIPIDVAAWVGREVCAALSYAHKLRDRTGQPLNLIHRDISPQNILISFQGECKIIDFGIAKVSTQMQQTQVGVIKGKFYYMSPEQAGAHDVDQRSDLFSLGICLWETLCGRSLFRRDGGPSNPLAILHEIRSMPIPRVRDVRPDCPPELDEIVARALARDLSVRYASADAMMAALNEFMMRHVPSFSPSRASDFMVRAFEKVETTKETGRVTTRMADLMQRGEFQPSGASVIFQLPGDGHTHASGPQSAASIGQSDATQIFAGAAPPPPFVRREPPREVVAGIVDSSESIPEVPEEHHGDELAVSETVFLLKDDVEEMQRRGAVPEVQGREEGVDPNSVTHALSVEELRAAREAYGSGASGSAAPAVEPPLSAHPLFRWLVIAILVLCVLSATLALMLIQRSRQRAYLDQQQQQIRDTTEVTRVRSWARRGVGFSRRG